MENSKNKKVMISKKTKIGISVIGGTLIFFSLFIYFRFTNIEFLYKLSFNVRSRGASKILILYLFGFIIVIMGALKLTDLFFCDLINSRMCFIDKNNQ